MVSKCRIDIWDRGGSLSASELLLSNGRVCDTVTYHLGAVSGDSGNYTWFLVAARAVEQMCCTLRCT